MFGTLKEKLKNWITKNKETPEEEKPKKAKAPKKKNLKKKTTIKDSPKDEVQEKIEEIVKESVKEKTFFSSFSKKLTEEKFEEMFEELELILLQNNVAYEAVQSIKKSLEKKLIGQALKEIDLSIELKEAIASILINPPNFLEEIKSFLSPTTDHRPPTTDHRPPTTDHRPPTTGSNSPFVILFAGINGSGKTTTIAKVANYLQKNKLKVCLAAADTFRAAAIQQLEEHANKLKVPIIKKDYGADPASVAFDAITYARKNKIDVVLIDTAGRMQNKDSLMKEIEKISRVTKPNMKIFLGESITGNDATQQAKAFNESINIDGIILSKADVDEKGGTAISVSHITKKPILFLGTGQEYKDLEIFNKEKMIEKLGL